MSDTTKTIESIVSHLESVRTYYQQSAQENLLNHYGAIWREAIQELDKILFTIQNLNADHEDEDIAFKNVLEYCALNLDQQKALGDKPDVGKSIALFVARDFLSSYEEKILD